MSKTTFTRLLAIPAVVLALAACGDKRDDRAQIDAALSSDLALASQSSMYPQQMYMSPTEMGYAPGYQPVGYAQPQPQRVVYQQAQPRVVRTSTQASAQVEGPVVRNTKRDAILGATAGAVIGATTSRDKLKGAVIGAAAGGIIGGIIGHQVDVKRY